MGKIVDAAAMSRVLYPDYYRHELDGSLHLPISILGLGGH